MCTVKTFAFDLHKYDVCKIRYDVEIPLPEYMEELDLFGHLIAVHNVPLPFHEEVKTALRKFILLETHKFVDGEAERRLMEALQSKVGFHPLLPAKIKENKLTSSSRSDDSSFEENFKLLMQNSTITQLSLIAKEELALSAKMLALVRARNFEMERLTKACESAISGPTLSSEEEITQQSYNLAILNDKIRQVSTNYSLQIEALRESQRRDYRNFISRLLKNDERVSPIRHMTSVQSAFRAPKESGSSRTMKKSVSCDSQFLPLEKAGTHPRDESFTIYIGAQMKSMHNARILLCERLTELCESGGGASAMLGVGDDANVGQLYTSRRLHLLMSLYRRELASVVLVVGRNPLYHIHQRTKFARLCEQSAELHFDSLEAQLEQIQLEVRRVNRLRKLQRKKSNSSNAYDESGVSANLPDNYDENLLRPGDVYVTRHSNLSSTQIVFHLVVDHAIEVDDISSRHPCIGGLRNIVRLASKFSVQSISLPLLLVETMNETMTVPWCMSRAELIFKCLKGFLMEVCSTGSASSGGCSAAGVPTSHAFSTTTHYNVNFAMPAKISAMLFAQLIDLFSSIYHLVPSVNEK